MKHIIHKKNSKSRNRKNGMGKLDSNAIYKSFKSMKSLNAIVRPIIYS